MIFMQEKGLMPPGRHKPVNAVGQSPPEIEKVIKKRELARIFD